MMIPFHVLRKCVRKGDELALCSISLGSAEAMPHLGEGGQGQSLELGG